MKSWPVEAAGAVDAKNAPTAPSKAADSAVFHKLPQALLVSIETCITLSGDEPTRSG